MTMSVWEQKTLGQMVAYYNEVGPEVGRKPIAKFVDRATGVKRCADLQIEVRQKRQADAAANGAIAAVHKPGAPADHFELNPAGKAAVAAARAQQKGASAVTETSSDLPSEFENVKVSVNRKPLLLALAARKGEYVPAKDLVEAVYGAGSYPEARGRFGLVMKGLIKDTIGKNNVPMSIKTKKDGRNVSYGLFNKGH